MRNGEFRILPITERSGDYTYPTFQVVGYLEGKRVRKKFKSRDAAEGEKNRLEIAAANKDGAIRAVNTRLSGKQLAEAEAAFVRLDGKHTLMEVVEWFRANYRPPQNEMAIGAPDQEGTAAAIFLKERAKHVQPCVIADYKRTLTDFCAAFPGKKAHEVSTEEIIGFLEARGVGKKRYNNMRGEIHAFFQFCLTAPRRWVRENPVTPIPAFRLSRGLPEIITPETAAELMAFVENYDGGPDRKLPRGCLAPYFALCLFAGIRPDPLKGEIKKLSERSDLEKLINAELGTIRILPEISKVKTLRQITIQPNLAAWLARYPVNDWPILPCGFQKTIKEIRQKFGLSSDVLRHTFISAHVAKFQSMGAAALEAGNSERMIKVHYLNAMTKAAADAFWAIVPKAPAEPSEPIPANVVSIAA